MRFPFDFSKLSFFGNSWGLGMPKELGIFLGFFWEFLGISKKTWDFLGFSYDFFGIPENLGFFWDFFGIVHVCWNILIYSMFLCAGSGYFYFVL